MKGCIPSLWLCVLLCVCLILLCKRYKNKQFTQSIIISIYRVVTEAAKTAAAKKSAGHVAEETSPIGFFQAFLLPNVISYAAAFGFFKLVSKLSVLFIHSPNLKFFDYYMPVIFVT